MFELIDRRAYKQKAAEVLRTASVPAQIMTAFYMALLILLSLFDSMAGSNLIGSFITIFTSLLSSVLAAGFGLYCIAIRRGERAEYLTLFDGFSFVGKIILLSIVRMFFITLWSMLFVIPGIVAAFRYRFAFWNLYENPGIGVMEALDMSKRQTMGYKSQLLLLDLSYLGWGILSTLPAFVVSYLAISQVRFTSFSNYNAFYDAYTAAVANPAGALGIPAWVMALILGLWSLMVSLFYYPNYVCTELEYFETAKSTSGIGKDVPPWSDGGRDQWGSQGPDGLGGF
ncbi:MAG: DUF975 family protein [Oscillibacter sp.]|jgi:uncharacterized membrane protein|nr:DUF975 family protein [Oscillibacter sp.]